MIPIFDEDTDYAALEAQVRDRFSFLTATGSQDDQYNTRLFQVARYLKQMDIERDSVDQSRYNSAVKISYLILF